LFFLIFDKLNYQAHSFEDVITITLERLKLTPRPPLNAFRYRCWREGFCGRGIYWRSL